MEKSGGHFFLKKEKHLRSIFGASVLFLNFYKLNIYELKQLRQEKMVKKVWLQKYFKYKET